MKKYSVVLLSGGKGMRMKKDIPKQYLLLAGKPVIMHSLERLDNIDEISEIIIVCEKEFQDSIELMTKQYNIETKVVFVSGGKTRQESVYNGLQLVTNADVIIHEAARPFAVVDDFMRLIHCENENVILGEPIPFTVVKGGKFIVENLNRSELVNVQLPQKFNTKLIYEAHKKAAEEERLFTEDATLLFYYTGLDISIIPGSSYNIKITDPVDLIVGENIYSEYIARRK